MDRVDRKWTKIWCHFQEGYGPSWPEIFYESGQKWTKILCHFQEGYGPSWPQQKVDKSEQKWTNIVVSFRRDTDLREKYEF